MRSHKLRIAVAAVAGISAIFFASQTAISAMHSPVPTRLTISHHASMEAEAVFTQFLGKTDSELQQYLVARGLQGRVEVFGCAPKSYPQGLGPDGPMNSPIAENIIARVRLCDNRVEMVVERHDGGAVSYAIS